MTESDYTSSSISTGGAGPVFEHHVGAMYLGLLLTRGIPAVLRDCQVEEVSFQTGYLGWKTDDLLVTCVSGDGRPRRLAMQVKRTFKVGSSSPDFIQTFQGFWKDFVDVDRFNQDEDSLILVTLRQTESLRTGLGGLLDCARASSDETDFAERLTKPGFISKRAKGCCTLIRTVVELLDDPDLSERDFWRFLKSIHLLSVDFTTSTSQGEAWVKQILAQSATCPDPVSTSEMTWNELLRIAAASASGARIVGLSDLPEATRARHRPIEGPSTQLRALLEHSATTRSGIRSSIGDAMTLPRNAQLTQAIEALTENQVVFLTGDPGSGKSVLAKSIIEQQETECVCLTFRAEEFASSHIDSVLASISGMQLATLLGAQERVLIHIDSMERLLEHSTRDAFADLLRMVECCQNIRVLLTCRNSTAATASDSFFHQSGLTRTFVEIPPLSDEELTEVEASLPRLTTPLSNPTMRRMLRNPYLLDMAARINWSVDEDLPSDIRAFRQSYWSKLIRRDDIATSGLPDRRDRTLVDLAVHRARQLRPYVPVDSTDAEALDALHKDGIVARTANGFAAPIHDVIEDWAIIRWVDALAEKHEWQTKPLAVSISPHPAIRRAFREWLKECLDRGFSVAHKFIVSAWKDASIPRQFQDDTLVAMLLSHSAEDFVSRQKNLLWENDAELLIRLTHLTRVACRKPPVWVEGPDDDPLMVLGPDGEAWCVMLDLAADDIDSLLPAHSGTVIALLENWANGTGWLPSLQPGATSAGKIAFRMLEDLGDYGSHDLRERVLTVIAKVPRSNERSFLNLVEQASSRENRRSPVSNDFARIVLGGTEGIPACRDFPKQMAQLTLAWCCLSNTDPDPTALNSMDIDPAFGLRSYLDSTFFPTSAYRGPFLPLLNLHPSIGFQLVLDLLNHTGYWYAEPKHPNSMLEPARETAVTMADGREVRQWANERLWMAYRGTSVVPNVIECALMGLESWLLRMCEEDEDVEEWMLKVLSESNNVMTTAVLGSVCIAYPERTGEVPLALLTSLDAIVMDRWRMVKETDAEAISSIPSLNPTHQFYRNERRRSNGLAHRRQDIEGLALRLQFGEKRERVWEIIDAHRAQIPDEHDRTEADRLRLLALHRMDIRNKEVIKASLGSEVDTEGEEDKQPDVFEVRTRGLEDDVQEIVDSNAGQLEKMNEVLGLSTWARRVWQHENDDQEAQAWRSFLELAVRAHNSDKSFAEFIYAGVGITAAVCIRDHWKSLTEDERQWCIRTLITEIERNSDNTGYTAHLTNDSMAADRHSAYVLPKVLAIDPDSATVAKAVATAITHGSAQVSLWACEGVGRYLASERPAMLLRCAGALAMQVRLASEAEQEDIRSGRQWIHNDDWIAQSVLRRVRESFVAEAIDAQKELSALDLTTWHGRYGMERLLSMFVRQPHSPLSQLWFTRAGQAIARSWAEDNEESNSEREILRRLARFILSLPTDNALRSSQPILDGVEKHPDKVATFVELLIEGEDAFPHGTTCFWEIWQTFADRVTEATWAHVISTDVSPGVELIERLLLKMYWKEGLHHWDHLEGNHDRIDRFVRSLPATPPVLMAYTRYLYTIGSETLPGTFQIVAERLDTGHLADLLSNGPTVFYLVSLLQRHVYVKQRGRRTDPDIRRLLLSILDNLVDAGSSEAYRMRDDFVTPFQDAEEPV